MLNRLLAGVVSVALASGTLGSVIPTGAQQASRSAPPAAKAVAPKLSYIRQFGDGDLFNPGGVAIAPDGSFYVAGTYADIIVHYSATGSLLGSFGTSGSGDGQFAAPAGIAVDKNGNVYVADSSNDRVQKLNADGSFVMSWGGSGSSDDEFAQPRGIAVDSTGDVIVADTYNDRLVRYSSSGVLKDVFGNVGALGKRVTAPHWVAVDSKDNVYVIGEFDPIVQVYSPSGDSVRTWETGSFDAGTRPLAIDSSDRVYIGVDGEATVEVFTTTGVKLGELADTQSTASYFDPLSIAADERGSVVVGDLIDVFTVFGDVTRPTVNLRRPGKGVVYPVGTRVIVDYSCVDDAGGAGLVSCKGTAADGSLLPTGKPSSRSITVTAKDRAGNATKVTNKYSVAYARPDLSVRSGPGGDDRGQNVYGSLGKQTVKSSGAAGAVLRYFVTVQNDAGFTDRIVLRGGKSVAGMKVAYRVGLFDTDVTKDVVAGRYETPKLAPGERFIVDVVVTVGGSASIGKAVTTRVTGTSATHDSRVDAVAVTSTRTK